MYECGTWLLILGKEAGNGGWIYYMAKMNDGREVFKIVTDESNDKRLLERPGHILDGS